MYNFGTLRAISLGRVVISGSSMSPTYNDGDWLLVKWTSGSREVKASRATKLDRGKVVIVERESQPGVQMIKRINQSKDGLYWVEGDNPLSTGSRQWGWLEKSEITGQVLFRIKRAKRLS